MVHVQAGGVDRLAGAVAGDAGVAAAVLLPDIHQDEAVLGARAGDLVSGRVCFNPQQILQRFFLQPVHTGSRGAYGCEKKKQQTLPSTFKNISIKIIQLGEAELPLVLKSPTPITPQLIAAEKYYLSIHLLKTDMY